MSANWRSAAARPKNGSVFFVVDRKARYWRATRRYISEGLRGRVSATAPRYFSELNDLMTLLGLQRFYVTDQIADALLFDRIVILVERTEQRPPYRHIGRTVSRIG